MVRTQTSLMRQVVEEAGRCELCGSRRNLQAHHIIPYVLYQTDSIDNLICVCGACHAKLTPKNLLVRIGMSKARGLTPEQDLKLRIYKLIAKKLEGEPYVDNQIFFEAIDEA